MSASSKTLESALIDFIDNAPVGIFRTQGDGRIALANSAFVRMLGYPDMATLHQVNAARLCADPRDSMIWMRELNRHGVVQHFETRLGRHDGRPCGSNCTDGRSPTEANWPTSRVWRSTSASAKRPRKCW